MEKGLTWEEETITRLKEAEVKLKQIKDAGSQAEKAMKYWQEYFDTLTKLLQLSKEHPISEMLDFERFRKQSTWDNLSEIMRAKNGLLVVIDAVTTLVKAGVFADREHARNVIYSALYSHKKDVQRMRKGVYRISISDSFVASSIR